MTWLRRNRWWLVALPVTLTLLVAGSSRLVEDLWWRADLHDRVDHAAAGEWAHWSDRTTEISGEQVTRSLDVRLVGLRETDERPQDYGDPTPLPKGSAGLLPELEFRSPVGPMAGCAVTLVATDGTRYGGSWPDAFDQYPCFEPQVDSSLPPEEWTSTPVVAVDPGVEIEQVWISFGTWQYVALDVPKA